MGKRAAGKISEYVYRCCGPEMCIRDSNYTNPMAMLVSYLQSMSDMNITGLCHSVQGTAEMLAKWIGAEEKQEMCIRDSIISVRE